jgi:hypothetical protein
LWAAEVVFAVAPELLGDPLAESPAPVSANATP